MNEKKPSLTDQLKQAELERLRSEIDKNKAEEALFRRQINEVWYSGRSLRLIISGIITAATLGGIFYTAVVLPIINLDKEIAKREAELADKKSQLAQAQIDSLNREKTKITATIDSLKIRSIISANFDNLDSAVYANVLEMYKMILANNYFDRRLNPKGAGIENSFKLLAGDSIVYDATTALYWQRSGSSSLTFVDANKYVEQLNVRNYGGYSDWRLPTLKEAMSLMKPEAIDDLFVHPMFDRKQGWIWSSDQSSSIFVWIIHFKHGYCHNPYVNRYKNCVRAVRS